ALIAREHGLFIDEAGFEAEMQKQKERARNATKVDKGDWVVLDEDFEKTEFVGYDTYETYTKIVKYRELKDAKQTYFQVVLDQTPFYAESGGQVGDTGVLMAGDKKLTVFDTKKENDLIVHLTKDDVKKFVGEQKEVKVLAKIDSSRRQLIANNHSATHLVHAALRKVLGTHVTQKGSLVNESLLRFDFSHFAKVTEEELDAIEKLVNQKIRENIPLEVSTNVPIEKAKAMGAMALFGEKYGDFVRVVTFDKNYSVELCGGTHVPATGKIGLFTFISESSVAAGVRRIEAITAEKAEEYIKSQRKLIQELSELLKNPKDLKKAVADLVEERNRLAKELEKYRTKELQHLKTTLLHKVTPYKEVSLIVEKVELPDADSLKTLCFELRNAVKDLFAVIATEINGKPQIAIMIADDVVKSKNYNAATLVKELATEIKGGGGGQPFFATAGGSDASGLEKALAKVKALL
ncbi:MAG: alanine--tRNA ligase-related protein, partial [Flammeovirgaceae bacterium]|nr:alanine--tRNA ligase-related protein [Flammeovirgaceae bacterium]MDW8286614.1 alanine--tRNA ligase-related protein [Flammeovirgaceae bacterium]